MNKILVENRIKSFRIFYISIPKSFRFDKKDKVKEFINSLKSELFNLKKKPNKENIEKFKEKYFMMDKNTNTIEYDFFNDELIHTKLYIFDFYKKSTKMTIEHDIEVMEKILECYEVNCSLNIDYSDMKITKELEKVKMNEIIGTYKKDLNQIKNNKKIDEFNLFVEELKNIIELSNKISTKTSAIIFSQVLINNILKTFLNVFYNKDLNYLECENKFFFSNIKETEYYKEILNNSIDCCLEIINCMKNANYNESELIKLEDNIHECLYSLEKVSL